MDDLALSLASTIRHDGAGGVADDLTDRAGLSDWVTANATLLADTAAAIDPADLDDAALRQVRELRGAVRALFARAVRPDPPSRPDAHRLIPAAEAIAMVNAAAARQPLVPRLSWDEESGAASSTLGRPGRLPAADRLAAEVARSMIALLTGPHASDLRSCPAPRCVRYFIREHPRQQWCKPSCGTRARVARHYRRHHPADDRHHRTEQ